MSLATFWFLVIALLWAGFLVLEGFDFGVGMLHAWLGRDEVGRRVVLATIGPVWDGNEVWLIVAGAGTFAAFPGWYATMFSSLYLPLVLLLLALIVRGASLEFRGKRERIRWRRTWSAGVAAGSLLAPLLIGVALGDLLHGLPIDAAGAYTGGFVDLLTGYGLAVGVTVVLLCLVHGANFVVLRTDGDVRGRAARLSRAVAPVTALAVIGTVLWTRAVTGGGAGGITGARGGGGLATTAEAVAAAAILAAVGLGLARRQGWAFGATATSMAGLVAAIFASLYPRVMVSTLGRPADLTVANTASARYALTVMTVVTAVLFPIVLVYQGWTYHVFRHRVSRSDFAAPSGGPAAAAARPADR